MADDDPAATRCPFCEARPGQAITATEAQAQTHRAHKAACIRCGGTEDLMDRAMAPGMTYCAPCRRALREGG